MNFRSLAEAETVIDRGLAAERETYVEMGRALEFIRSSRMYARQYRTFDNYCQQRWGFADRRANDLVRAAKVHSVLARRRGVEQLPANSAQALELGKLCNSYGDPTDQEVNDMASCWQHVIDAAPRDTNGRPVVTTKMIRTIADQVTCVPDSEQDHPPADEFDDEVSSPDFLDSATAIAHHLAVLLKDVTAYIPNDPTRGILLTHLEKYKQYIVDIEARLVGKVDDAALHDLLTNHTTKDTDAEPNN